jgi:hypothetical protein
MVWTVQQETHDDSMETGFDGDPSDPASEPNFFGSSNGGALSQDDRIKADEVIRANEARRVADIERAQQERERLQRIEQERLQELSQRQHAQLQQERWQQLMLLQQQQLQLEQQSHRREVSFADSALLYSSDRTIDEVSRMWYTKDELANFKNERKGIVKVLKRTNFDVAAVERSGKYCLRGYEAYFSLEVNKAMKDARSLALSLVLTEQDRQRALGIRDVEAIRFACSAVSQWACDNAVKLGEDDEMDVYGIYDDAFGANYSYFGDERYNSAHYCTNSSSDVIMEQADSSQRSLEIDSGDDNLAERLESALRLVRALRSGTQASSIGS